MSAKKKKSWFEAWCTMDAEPASPKNKGRSTAAARQSDRVRVKSRSDSPFSGEDVPPFDDTPAEPIGDGVFDGLPRRGGTASGKRSTSARPNAKSAKRSAPSDQKRGKTADAKKPLPAEVAYRMQPYLVLGIGALLGVMLLLSAIMSGGTFDWSASTHPFRFLGYWIENILFGLFGYGAYLIPAAMIYLSADRIRAGVSERVGGRGYLAGVILVLVPAMVHTCMIDAGAAQGVLQTWSLKSLYTLGAQKLGGGVLGGYLGRLFHLGLGVIGTLVVGGAALIVLLMVLFGITPLAVWQRICAWRDARRARRERYREIATAQTPSGQLMIPDETGDGDGRAVSKPSRRKAAKEHAEVDAPDTEDKSRDSDEDAVYLDPTQALLRQNRRAKRAEAAKETEGTPPFEAVDGEAQTPADVFSNAWSMEDGLPMEAVNELSAEQIAQRERSWASAASSVATTVSPEDEPDADTEAERMVDYPNRAEIDLEAGGVVSPLETPVDDHPEQTVDYQGGFDYSMDGETPDEEEELPTDETVGGVTIHVERLSQEERERGQTLAQPQQEEPEARPYVFPTVDLMSEPRPRNENKEQEVRAKMNRLRETLVNFKVNVDHISYVCGPSVTRYEVRPAPGVRVKSVAGLADDIAMNLAAQSIRIEAPIPGKSAVGIEVPNTTRETVSLRPLIDSDEFRSKKSRVTACLGQDVAGTPILFDIAKMPHLLVAGTTNSGKSVCINSIVMSLLYKSTPQELKFIMIDPKQVEFTVYKDIPHLMAPIVCDAKRAAAVLNLAVQEMEKRFQRIREVGMKNIAGYNEITATDRYEHPYMPYIVIVIDELAELMMQARDEVETSIVRLAQKARAAGIHLIIGTQRPSVDVITGLIKSNIPSRIAFTVASQVDSRTILDNAGAEKLLGMGDMLYAPIGSPKPLRVQGAFVSDDEVERIITFIKKNNDPVRYDQEFLDNIDREAAMIGNKRQPDMDDDVEGDGGDGSDPKFYEALRIAVENKRISTSLLQRMLSIGYGRAAKIIDQMEHMGYVGPAVGNKPREIRITEQAFAELMMNREE